MSTLEPIGRSAWVAVRERGQAEVLEALGLTGGRVVDVPQALEAASGGATALLPPLRGVGGRWTLVVGGDVHDLSERRLTTLSAMLGTDVQTFSGIHDGTRRCVLVQRGRVQRELDVTGEELPRVAGDWSFDPTSYAGPDPDSALLVDALRAEPPTPDTEPGLVQLPARGGFWGRILGR